MKPQPTSEQELFHAALELPPAQRAGYLAQACPGDDALRARVEALLAVQSSADALFDPASLATHAGGSGTGTGGTVRLTSPTEKPGDIIGPYKIREQVGEGGCGVVYVAEQEKPIRRKVALKVIKLGMDTKSVIARFEAERQALAMMDHPNIAKVLDAGTTNAGRPYFVMELVRGIKITDYCDQANLSTKDRLDLFIKVCSAIQHAHQKGIIHRDIKPSNILVTLHDGVPVPKVIDFGIAKATEGRLTDATVYTELHAFIGTPAYMSPEQAEMSGLDIDTRADIYSLGVLLYELLTGKPPFDAKELMSLGLDAMRRTIREVEPARPSTRLGTLSGNDLTTLAKRRSVGAHQLQHQLQGDLDWIVMKALEKDRTRRYETANGFAADITRHLTNEPVVACPPSTMYRLRKFIRRKPVHAAFAGMAILLLLGFAGLVVLHNRGLNERYWQSLLNLARAERLTQNRARSLDAIAGAARIRTDSDLRNEAIQTIAQAGVRLEQRVPYGKEAWFTLSADGNLLMAAGVVQSYPGNKQTDTPKVRVYETATGKLVNEIGWKLLGPLPAFSPNARVVALPEDDKAIVIWEPRTGTELSRVTGDGALMFSPDSQWLAIAKTNGTTVARWANPKEEKRRATGAFLTFTRDGDALMRDGERIVKWNFRESTETPLTPVGLKPLAVNADGKFAALWDAGTNNGSGSIVVFDLLAGKQLAVLRNQRQSSIPVRFSADGRLLAFSDTTDLDFGQQAVRIYDVETGRYRRSLSGVSPKPGPFKKWRSWWSTNQWDLQFDVASPGAIYGGQFIGDGSLFAALTGINELSVTVWNTETGEPVATLPKSSEFAASADGRWLASISARFMSFINYGNGDTYAFEENDKIIGQVAGVPTGLRKLPRDLSPRVGFTMTGTGGLVLDLWSVATAVPTVQIGSEVHTLAFSRDGRTLAAGGRWNGQGSSRLWTVESRGDRLALHPRNDLPIQGRIYFAGADRIMEAQEHSGTNPSELKLILRQLAPTPQEATVGQGYLAGAPTFSADGRKVAVASYGYTKTNNQMSMTSQTLEVLDAATLKPVKAYSQASSDWSPGALVISPDGRRLATSAFLREGLDLFDAETLTRQWHSQRAQLTEGEILRIRLGWLFGKGKDQVNTEYGVYQIAFTPDGKRIVSASANYILIRDADTGAELAIGRGHEGYISSLAVSQDGKFAVTGGVDDHMIRIWEIPTAREVARWEAHDSAVTALAFTPDGATLASGSLQGTLKLWNVPALRRELAKMGLDWP